VEIMAALKHFEQMHKPSDIEKDAIPKAASDPAEALAGLRQALESEDGFVLLTGPAGAGKSMLVQDLLPHLTCMVSRATIPDKEMTNQDFRRSLAEALGLETKVHSRGAFLLQIRDFLMSEVVKDHRIILVLESIQCLNKKLFKELELLSDICIRDRNPITFLFVGLTEAESIFSDPYLAKIANRICLKIRLKDADSDDVGNLDDVRRHIRERSQQSGADAPAVDKSAGQLETQTQRHKDRDLFQHSRASVQRIPQSELDSNAPPEPGDRIEPEGMPPLGSGLEPDANSVAVDQFQEGDWEDRVLMQYIDRTHLNRDPVPQRPEGQWYDSASTHGGGIEDDLEKGPVASRPALNRSSFVWGALSVISVLLLFFSVWIHFFDESGALSRFFIDTADKIESLLFSAGQGDTDDASPEPAAKLSPPSSEINTQEPAKPASPGDDSADDTWSLQTGAMVQFDSNSYEIGAGYAKLLDRVAAYLERHPEQHISLQGYSDNIGSRDYNLFISKYRALVVKYCLIGKGVPEERMQILGMGEGHPIGSNDTPEGRRHNRRVEIKLISDSPPDPGPKVNP
jgi:OOP family OmpA-OmpF porin